MKNILISTSTFNLNAQQAHVNDLAKEQYALVTNPYKRRNTLLEISELLKNGVVGLIAGLEPLTREVLEQATDLKVISRCGVGLDNVDLDAAKALKIDVYNTPEAPAVSVSELTLGLILSLLRKLKQNDHAVQTKAWKPMMGRLLSKQTVGIIGYGRIGQKVAHLLSAFGSNILVYDPFFNQKKDERFVELDYLLANTSVVTLHLPGTSDNYHFLDEEKLSLMPKNSVLINTARGGLVDEGALYRKLSTEQLAGAALDVFENEPYEGALLGLPNLILTSHIGSYAEESRMQMEDEAMKNLLFGLHKKGIFADIPRNRV
jgi:D-3-phosphoglycerate dehydrogenase / 2-oxoglutarate reductase